MPFGMSVPDLPDVPAIPEIPKVPELPSGGGGDGADAGPSIDDMMAQVDELNGKLDASENMIYGMLAGAIPTVNIPMPKLKASMFGGTDDVADEKVPLLADTSRPVAAAKAGAALSPAKKKAEALRLKTEAAKKKALDAQQEMADQAKAAMDQAGGAGKQIAGQALAAATSIAIGVGCSYAPLGPLMGQILAGVMAAAINFLGLAMSWKTRANSVFKVLNGVFDRMIKKVTDILDQVDDMIMGPLEKLENAIDDMADEQKPTIDKMKKFEAAMKMADPSFDLPEPADLQKPLDGCDAMIDDFVEKAKKEIPDKLTEMIQSSTAGKVATDEGQFNLYVVYLPLLVVLLINVALAVLQVVIMFSPPDADSADDKVVEADRRLRGSHSSHSQGNFSSPELPKGMKIPEGMDADLLMPYIQPALVQVALAALQVLGAMMLSSGPRICALVNDAVADFGKKVNERVNLRIKTAVDKVFGEAFKMVKEKSDQFFPKFKDATKQLKKAMEMAGKAEALAKAAQGAAAAIGGVI